MGLTCFDIVFDNPTRIYYPGFDVTGRLIIQLDTAKRADGVYVKLTGEGNVHWTEQVRDSSKNTTETEVFEASESYFTNKICVFRPSSSSGEIPPGRHEYPFRFLLPAGIPSSFESQWGYVRYICTAKIDRPWKFDHRTREPFTVNAFLDLNADFNNKIGINQEDVKHRCCCCCKSGPITVQAKIPKSGFVPGEYIPIDLTVDNTTSDPVTTVTVKLEQKVLYNTPRKVKTEERNLAKSHLSAVNANENKVFDTVHLLVPAVPPSRLGGHCRIIEVLYIVTITVNPGRFSTNLTMPCNVTIGSVPLSEGPPTLDANGAAAYYGFSTIQQPGQYPPGQQPAYPPAQVPSGPQASAPILPFYQGLPPPSYEDSVFGKVDIKRDGDEHVRGETAFAPRYPMYGFTVPQ